MNALTAEYHEVMAPAWTKFKNPHKTPVPPFAAWKADLVLAIRFAIARARKEGLTAIGIENLMMMTRVPAGGPTGTNAAYYFKTDWFPAAVAKLPKRDAAFILA